MLPINESQGYTEQVIETIQRRARGFEALPRFVKFATFLFLIAGVTLGGYVVWDKYLSPRARSARETQKNYESYLAWEKKREQAMREDTYGGATPRETLDLFIAALEKNDLDLASRYFVVNTGGSNKDFQKLLEEQAKQYGGWETVVNILKKAQMYPKDRTHDNDYKMIVFGDNNNIEAYIDFELNPVSRIWKIESL